LPEFAVAAKVKRDQKGKETHQKGIEEFRRKRAPIQRNQGAETRRGGLGLASEGKSEVMPKKKACIRGGVAKG